MPNPTHPASDATPDVVARLQALSDAATPGDLSTAERHTESEIVECPMCNGDGEVEATDYCNFDGVALGVQFYGIGREFGAHEALWKALRNAVPDIIEALRERDELRERLERANHDLKIMGVEYPKVCSNLAEARAAVVADLRKYAGKHTDKNWHAGFMMAVNRIATGQHQGEE